MRDRSFTPSQPTSKGSYADPWKGKSDREIHILGGSQEAIILVELFKMALKLRCSICGALVR